MPTTIAIEPATHQARQIFLAIETPRTAVIAMDSRHAYRKDSGHGQGQPARIPQGQQPWPWAAGTHTAAVSPAKDTIPTT